MNHYWIIFTSQLHEIKDNFQPFAVASTCSLRECLVYTKETRRTFSGNPERQLNYETARKSSPCQSVARQKSWQDYLLLVLFTAVLLRYLYAVYEIETFTQINFLSIK